MKNNKMNFLVPVFFVCYFVVTSVMAVDGYKNLKFGMTKKQIIKSNICEFEDGHIKDGDYVESLKCYDFKFGNKITDVVALFIDGKFLRLAITIPSENMAVSLMDGLFSKYGAPSSLPTSEELEIVSKFPNQEAYLAFDKDTIVLKFISLKDYTKLFLLMYTSPNYKIILKKRQLESMGNDF